MTPTADPRLRRLSLEDFEAARAIEQAAFTSGWSPTAFEHELRHNASARYVLLERRAASGAFEAAAFGGLWLMFDQAHIVTVAVLPSERRQGYGRLLVHALLAIAEDAGMDDATLEVRVSNVAARALYRGYGFHEVGERKRYYADNGEDAVIMTTEAFASDGFRRRWTGADSEVRAHFPAVFAQPFAPGAWGFSDRA